MRRIGLAMAILACVAASADGPIVVRRTPVVVTPNLLNETFDAAGYDNAVCGSTPCWTEVSSTSLINEDSSTCGSGVGWSGQCLRINAGVFDNPKLTYTIAAQSGDFYFTASMKLTFTLDTDADRWGVFGLDDATDETGGMTISIVRAAGPVYSLVLYNGSMGVLDSVVFTSGSQVCIQAKMNATSDDWEWRVGDGTTQTVEGSASGTGAFTVSPTTLHVGTTTVGSADAVDIQLDSVKLGSTGWLGCP